MRGVLITWAAALPTITVLLFALEGLLGHWPLALRTLLLTGLMVPAMTLVIVPMLTRMLDHFSKTIGNGVTPTPEPDPTKTRNRFQAARLFLCGTVS